MWETGNRETKNKEIASRENSRPTVHLRYLVRRCLWFVTQNRETRNKEKASRKNSLFIRRESGIPSWTAYLGYPHGQRIWRYDAMVQGGEDAQDACCSVLQSYMLQCVAVMCVAVCCSHVCYCVLQSYVVQCTAVTCVPARCCYFHFQSTGARRRRALSLMPQHAIRNQLRIRARGGEGL